MPVLTVVPKYVNPKGDKKYASINDGHTFYGFDPNKVPMDSFRPGVAVSFEYETKSFNGKDYHTITKIVQRSGETNDNGHSNVQASFDRNQRQIMLQAIAKSCIEAGLDMKVADQWIAWIDGQMGRRTES